MKNKINILQINSSPKWGGVSSFQYNYYTNLDRDKFEFTFLSPRKSSFEIKRKEIEANNDKICGLDVKGKNIVYLAQIYIKLRQFLKKNEFDIIHINSGVVFFNAIASLVSKKYGKCKVIVHSHSAYQYKGIQKIIAFFAKKIIHNNSDYLFACSEKAADSMFPREIIENHKYTFVPNSINVKLYRYDEDIRNKIRTELNISNDCILLGNIARLTKVKNHEFMIKLVEYMRKKNIDVKLVLIGDGELKEELIKKVEEKNLKKFILFLGMQEYANKYYNAMDALILPSFSEGFGLVALEAQANGLKCILSNTIPEETKITNLVQFADINNIDEWVEKIINSTNKNSNRSQYNKEIEGSNFNIKMSSKEIEKFYIEITK